MVTKWIYVNCNSDIEKIDISINDIIYFDFETTDVDITSLIPLLFGFRVNDNYYIINLYNVDYITFRNFISDYKNNLFVAHNAKFDVEVMLYHYHILLDNVICTMVQEQVLYNGLDMGMGYEDLVLRLQENSKHLQDNYGIDVPTNKLNKALVNSFIKRNPSVPYSTSELNYLYEDLVFLPIIHEAQEYRIDKFELYETIRIERALVPILAKLEVEGINFNYELHREMILKWFKRKEGFIDRFRETIKRVNKHIKIIDEPLKKPKATRYGTGSLSMFSNEEMYSEDVILDNFNFNSSTQLLTLFKRAGIKLEKTNEPSLVEYIKNNKRTEAFEIIDILLEYRETEKLISTYGESFAANKNPITGKMHPKYMQAFTVTGRLSSNDFNIQNIPKELRPCFIPDNDDYCFVTCDLSGQELRIAASHSQDKAILRNFTGGDDLHSLIAQESYRIIYDDPKFEVSKKVNGDLRNHHKATTFAWIYRAGFKRVMITLNTTEEKAKRIVRSMESIMPKLSSYLKAQMLLIYSEAVIRDNSFTNRLKWISDEMCPAKEDYKKSKEAANFPIQATGASMMKLAMVLVHRHIKENNLDWRLILTVHDELVVQIPKIDCEESANTVKLLMEKAGNYFLHNVVMESEKVIASYWNK